MAIKRVSMVPQNVRAEMERCAVLRSQLQHFVATNHKAFFKSPRGRGKKFVVVTPGADFRRPDVAFFASKEQMGKFVDTQDVFALASRSAPKLILMF